MPLPYFRRIEYERAYYLRNKEKRKAYVKAWRAKRTIEGIESLKKEEEKAMETAAWKVKAEALFLENTKKAQG